jgi:hypothetical protein
VCDGAYSDYAMCEEDALHTYSISSMLLGPGGKPPDKSLRSDEAAAAPKLSEHALVSLFQMHMRCASSSSALLLLPIIVRPQLAPPPLPPPSACIRRVSFAASLYLHRSIGSKL